MVSAEPIPIWAEAGAMAHGTALRIHRRTAIDYLLFAEPATNCRPLWRIGEIETDARMLFTRTSASNELNRVGLVDGSYVRHHGRPGLRLPLGHIVPAIHLDHLESGTTQSCAASPVS